VIDGEVPYSSFWVAKNGRISPEGKKRRLVEKCAEQHTSGNSQ